LLEQGAQRFHRSVLMSLGLLRLLPGVNFGLGLSQFVTTFVDLVLRGFIGLSTERVVLGLQTLDPKSVNATRQSFGNKKPRRENPAGLYAP
jgi:hypothetical protein